MAKLSEPRLCSECPLTDTMKKQIVHGLLAQQYTMQHEQPTTLKECQARRLYLMRLGVSCPYFSHTETLTIW